MEIVTIGGSQFVPVQFPAEQVPAEEWARGVGPNFRHRTGGGIRVRKHIGRNFTAFRVGRGMRVKW